MEGDMKDRAHALHTEGSIPGISCSRFSLGWTVLRKRLAQPPPPPPQGAAAPVQVGISDPAGLNPQKGGAGSHVRMFTL